MKTSHPFLIAEISANHCGNFSLAKKLIKCAKDNGADAAKLQTYTADTMTIKSSSEIFNYTKFYIGDNVDIGTQFYINTNNHRVEDEKKPLAYQGAILNEIEIGSDIWIGARVTILSGVKIENRVVVGAGSVVTKILETGHIYAGVPAKKIKKI